MNKIEAFKTTDGKIFEDEAEAEAHDTRLAAMVLVGELLDSPNCPIHMNSFDRSDLIEYMVLNTDRFVDALSGIATVEDTGEESIDLDDEPEGETFAVLEEHASFGERMLADMSVSDGKEEEFDSLGRGNGSDGSEAPAAQPDDDIPF